MDSVGIDPHKKTVSLCVFNQEREVLDPKRLGCSDTGRISGFLEAIRPFQVVVETTARGQAGAIDPTLWN